MQFPGKRFFSPQAVMCWNLASERALRRIKSKISLTWLCVVCISPVSLKCFWTLNDNFLQVLLFVFKNTPAIFSQIILLYQCLRTDPGREVFSIYPSFNLKQIFSREGDYSKWIEDKKQRKKVLVFLNHSVNSISQNPRVHLKCQWYPLKFLKTN